MRYKIILPVLWIRDILLRIRISGSVPLTWLTDPALDPDSAFSSVADKMPTKNKFSFKGENKVFLTFFACGWTWGIRIREDQKHTDSIGSGSGSRSTTLVPTTLMNWVPVHLNSFCNVHSSAELCNDKKLPGLHLYLAATPALFAQHVYLGLWAAGLRDI